MFKSRKFIVGIMLLIVAMMMLSGCATVKGMGDDLDTLGRGMHGQ